MKEEQFISTNSNIWMELETFSSRINKRGIKTLSSSEVKHFLHVFRLSSHHLAYARTHYPQSSTTSYLNSLIGQCHSHIYAVKKVSLKQVFDYFLYGFPRQLKEYRNYILVSTGFFALGLAVSLLMVIFSPDNANFFLPKGLVEGVKGGGGGGGEWNYPLMSSTIMINNISVSFKAFVLGITLGLGTIYVLFFNGAVLGSLTGLIYMYGNPINYWSLILPHGVIELSAIFIAGAAGLIIAKSLLIPGEYSRRHSLINGGKKAITLMAGVILMLIVAGIIEGFFTPLEIGEIVKLAFAGLTAILLIIYFAIPYFVRRQS